MQTQARDVSREVAMVELFKSGYTLQDIGDAYGLTRERVRQLIKRHGVVGKDGGFVVSHNPGAIYGCSKEEFEEITARFPNCATRYKEQKNSAYHRGIEWKLTFKEWISVWDGYWEGRGRGRGYVMCRKKDQGAYEIGNVFIASGVFNNTAYAMRRHHGIDIEDDPYFSHLLELTREGATP